MYGRAVSERRPERHPTSVLAHACTSVYFKPRGARSKISTSTQTPSCPKTSTAQSKSRGLRPPPLGPGRQSKTLETLASDRPYSPSVFRRNLQCQPVRGVNIREECHWLHACKSFKRAGVGTNDILECKFRSENAHRALVLFIPSIIKGYIPATVLIGLHL
jgi:hypothetical protein